MTRTGRVRVKAGILADGIATAPLVVVSVFHLLVVVLILVVHLFLELLHGLVVQLGRGVCILILSVLLLLLLLGRRPGRALAHAAVHSSLWGGDRAVLAVLGQLHYLLGLLGLLGLLDLLGLLCLRCRHGGVCPVLRLKIRLPFHGSLWRVANAMEHGLDGQLGCLEVRLFPDYLRREHVRKVGLWG